MPWPVTHVLIAEKVYAQHFNHLEKQAFILGTCFADIRYLGWIERDRTHIQGSSLTQAQKQTSFMAGLHFHNLTDAAWNAYIHIHSERLFSIVPHNRAMFHTLKIIQDKYLYDHSEGWVQIVQMFDSILPEELDFGMPETALALWHQTLADYLAKPPRFSDLDMLQLTLPEELVEKIRGYYQAYVEDATLQAILTRFYDQAEEFLLTENE